MAIRRRTGPGRERLSLLNATFNIPISPSKLNSPKFSSLPLIPDDTLQKSHSAHSRIFSRRHLLRMPCFDFGLLTSSSRPFPVHTSHL